MRLVHAFGCQFAVFSPPFNDADSSGQKKRYGELGHPVGYYVLPANVLFRVPDNDMDSHVFIHKQRLGSKAHPLLTRQP
jgi:hypothetical protein